MADGFEIATAYVKISPDLDGFAEDLESKLEEATAGAEGKVKVGADDAELDAALDDAKAKLDELDGKDATARLRADDGDLSAKADDATARLRKLGETAATVKLQMDKGGFDEESDDATAKLDKLDGTEASARLGLDKGEWDAEIAEANAQLDELKAKASSVRLGGGGSVGGGGSGGSGGEGGGEGSLIGAATLVGGGLLPGLGGAAAGLGLLGGTGFLALGGVGSALSAANQASQSTGLTAAQTAATNFSNQVQVTQAQQSVTSAKQQQAQNAVTSNDSIEQAEMNLASVTRNASASQVQALQSVQQAQQGVQQATYSLSEANYNLGQAYEQAREQIAQAQDQLADSKLSVQAASLAVQQAQYQETLTNQDAYSTDLTRQQATLAVAQAKQQLQDATDSETSAQYNANLVNSQGVDGSQVVVQAKQAQLAAQDSLTNANNSAADAQTNLTNTELNNAQQVKQAQMQLSQTREQAAYQAKVDAQTVAQAEQNVTNTIKEQQLQLAATESTANQAANQFAQDMAKLTPSARGLVNQILGLSGAYDQMKTAAQNAVVPGLSLFVGGLAKLMPTVQTGVTQMGGVISKVFGQMGQDMKSSGAQKMLQGLFTNGVQFVNTVLPAITNMVGAILSLGSQKGAVSGIAGLITGIANGISGFAQGLKPYIPDFNVIFQALGKIATAAGPALAKILGSIAQDLAPIAQFLNSKQGQPFVKAIGDIIAGMLTVKGLAKILPGELGNAVGGAPGIILKLVSKPLKSMLSSAFKSAFGSAAKDGEKAAEDEVSNNSGWITGLTGGLKSKLSGVFSSAFGGAAKAGEDAAEQELGSSGGMSGLIGGIGNMLGGLPGKITPIVDGIKSWGIWTTIASGATKVWTGIQTAFDLVMDANPVVLVALAIAGLVAGVIIAYEKVAWFRDGVKEAFTLVKNVALDLWHNVFDPMWHGIAQGAEWLYDNGIKPLWTKWIKPVFDDVRKGVESLVQDIGPVWAGIKGAFLSPVNFLIKTVYDDGIARLWNDVTGAVGLSSLKLPVIAGLAHGGMVPGTDHGRDEVLIAARPEEGVLVPGAVRAIGGAGAINALNSAHGGGGGRATGHYSLGGIVSDVIGGFTGTAKAVTALATGNTTAFVNAIAPSIGTSAAGALGQVMVAIPKTLLTDAAKKAESMFGGSAGGAATSSAVASWMAQAAKVAGAPASWIPDLETIASHESSDNTQAINMSDSNAAAGDPSRGLMQLIATTFDAFHIPGTSMNIFDPVANIAAGIGYIRSRYGTPGAVPGIVSLAQGGQYVGYDSGGWLPPGMTAAVNQTGKPEAVLTADEAAAFKEIIKQLSNGSGTSAPGGGVTMIWNGPQMPSQETLAEMDRHYSLLMS